jgi:alkylhydroperoxidase/carboxymuconolactone decarboxylase family protein YurZ
VTALTPRQEEIKARFIEVRGDWGDAWEAILLLDPEFLLAYLNFSAVPWRQNYLPDKVKELIYIAVDANATHMYLPGVRQHIKAALAAGATGAEIMEVLELAATLGIHAMNIGVPILVQVLVEKELRSGPAPLTERQEEIKADFTRARGYWHEFWDDMLELDPELFAAYTEFSSVPWRSGTLEPKVKEMVYIAFDTAATHLYVKGLKAHIENAIGYGATPQEILEVMEIASVLGIHGVTMSAPILQEELAQDLPGSGATKARCRCEVRAVRRLPPLGQCRHAILQRLAVGAGTNADCLPPAPAGVSFGWLTARQTIAREGAGRDRRAGPARGVGHAPATEGPTLWVSHGGPHWGTVKDVDSSACRTLQNTMPANSVYAGRWQPFDYRNAARYHGRNGHWKVRTERRLLADDFRGSWTPRRWRLNQ